MFTHKNIHTNKELRVRFLKKIQDWILKPKRIWKRILRFFTFSFTLFFRIMVHQRNRRIHFQSGFFGSFDAPWSAIFGLICLVTFSSPEPTIPLTCGRNRELWEQPLWKNKGNNRILVIRLTAHLHLWRMPEMVAPRALDPCRRPEGS